MRINTNAQAVRSMDERKQIRKTLLQAIGQSEKILLKNFLKLKEIREKSAGNPVTNADVEVEKAFRKLIGKKFPSHGVIGEEFPQKKGSGQWSWIIDPLDGTANYLRGIPFFNVSIGVARGKEVVFGAVANPLTREVFYAEKGKGAFLNGRPIRVSETGELSKAFVAFCDGHSAEERKRMMGPASKFKLQALDARKLGSAALELAFVACGRIEAVVAFATNPWDSAAGSLLVKEAGGMATGLEDLDWNIESKGIIACNRRLYPHVRKTLLG